MIPIDKYASFQGYLSMECPGNFVFVHYIRLFTKYEHALILNMAAMVFQVADNNAVKMSVICCQMRRSEARMEWTRSNSSRK